MIDTPNCELCVHNEVCKISKEITEFINKMHENGLNDDIPIGTNLDLKCTYLKHELIDYVC